MIDCIALPAVSGMAGGPGVDHDGLLRPIGQQRAADAGIIDLHGFGSPSSEDARLTQVERLSALHEQEALTYAEFAALKGIVQAEAA